MQTIFKTTHGAGHINVVKPGRFVRVTGDYMAECPFCGRKVRAYKKGNIYVIHQNCIPSLNHGHCLSVLSRDQYFTKHGNDEIFESNYPTIFTFKNINLDVRMVPYDVLSITLNHLNHVTPSSIGYYTLTEKKGRKSILTLHTPTGTEEQIAKAESYVRMTAEMEQRIAQTKLERSLGGRGRKLTAL